MLIAHHLVTVIVHPPVVAIAHHPAVPIAHHPAVPIAHHQLIAIAHLPVVVTAHLVHRPVQILIMVVDQLILRMHLLDLVISVNLEDSKWYQFFILKILLYCFHINFVPLIMLLLRY